MYYRLSFMMFLVYAIPGAWIPVLSIRLERELCFTPVETGMTFTGWALGAILASLIAGQIADRWLSVEKCISIFAGMAGILLLLMAEMVTPWAIILTTFGVCTFLVPIMTQSVTLSLRHLDHPETQFGKVRLWGTLGWISAGVLLWAWFRLPDSVNYWFTFRTELPSFADSMRLAGVMGVFLCLYSFTLPHTPPARKSKTWLAPLGAIHLLRRRSFAVLVACFFLMHVSIPFNIQQMSLMLKEQIGIPDRWVSLTLTLAQWSEVFMLFGLGALTSRMKVKTTLMLGISAWVLWLTVASIGQPHWLVVSVLTLNGVFITCFVVRGQVFAGREAGEDVRASAQGLITTANGFGLVIGNLLVGQVRDYFDRAFSPTFLVGACLAGVAFLLLTVGFEGRAGSLKTEEEEPAIPVTEEPSLEVPQITPKVGTDWNASKEGVPERA
ncbi:MAG: MFS transporter [Gemmataceae bacterium]